MAKIGLDLTDGLRLDFSNQWFEKDQGLPSWNNLPTTRTGLETRRYTGVLKLAADNIGPVNMSGYLDTKWKEEVYDDRYGDIGLGQQHNRYTTLSFGGHYFADWHVADWNTLSATLDVRREEYEPEDLLYTERAPNDSSRTSIISGIQDNFYLCGGRLAVIPGIRHSIVRDKLNSAVNSVGVPLPGKRQNKAYSSPQIGIKYLPAHWLTFKANYAKYTREPTFFELFGDRGFFLGNPDLVAEKGINLDAGIDLAWKPAGGPVSYLSATAAWFFSDVEDIITKVYNAQGIGKSVNVEGSEITGVESSLTIDFLGCFRLTANATWQDTVNLDSQSEFNGKDLPGRFKEAYLGRLEATYRGVTAHAEAILNRGMYYDTANLLEAADQKEVNAGVSLPVKAFLITLEGKNLTNERYEAFNGFPQPGQRATLTVKYTFRETGEE
jgi:iron complex outermembrane receptor protein